MGTVSDWHKKQRKKELKKNKEARLAARNERVVEEKSIPGIQKEIAALEATANPHHSTQMKIDRLKKELKLLQKHKETTPNQSSQSKPAVPRGPVYEPLPDPRVSIYYDAAMNPFGEPPPGRPRLFHRRGGGTTLTLRESCVPGEEEAAIDKRERGDKPSKSVSDSTPALKRQEPSRSDRKEDSYSLTNAKTTNREKQAAARPPKTVKSESIMSTEPKQVPELPQASAAVKRSRTLAVDIWASTSELEYDESWEYRDLAANQIQGPFGRAQMLAWIRAGHFPGHTMVRRVNAADWRPMSDVKELWGGIKKRKTETESTNVQSRIAALKKKSKDIAPDSVQGRIAALRGKAPPKDDVQSRITTLRGVPPPAKGIRTVMNDRPASRGEGSGENVMPNGEAALADNINSQEVECPTVETKATPLPPPPPPPPGPRQQAEAVDEIPSYPLPAPPIAPLPLPPPPATNSETEIPSYPIASDFESDNIPSYSLPYSSKEETPDDVIAPYPIPTPTDNDDEIVAAYPTPPSTVQDVVDDPVAKQSNGAFERTTETAKNSTPKLLLQSKGNIDKTLVAFLPTALQRKRTQPSK